jgi:hypothetical protein
MAEQVVSVGIKEAKEAIIGVNELAIFIASRLKDGVGVDDVMAVWEKLKDDEEFKTKIVAAYEGISLVPEEIKDMSLQEGLELAVIQVSYVPQLLAAIK